MSQRFTKEEFIARVFEKNKHVRDGEIDIFGEYNGLDKSIDYLCNVCGSIQSPIAASVLRGNGCNECARKKFGKNQEKTNKKFQDELEQLRKYGHDVFSDDKYTNNCTKMWFYCSQKHTWETTPAIILRGGGCPYCSNKRVLVGYNDIATTSPDIFELLLSKDDGYKYTRWSNKRVDFKCNLCGHIQNRKIASLAHRGFSCECCGNGISYPNKFGRAFFDQLPIEKYIAEYHPKWGSPYVYDIYFKLNEKEYVVEWDGLQHFEERNFFDAPLSKQQSIDQIKNDLARANNVHIIRIDCRKSESDYIKNNIEQSELTLLFDLSKIDWKLCDERAQSNLVKLACDLWMSGINSFDELSEKLHLGNSTVRDYINRGVKLGWCDYDSKKWKNKQCHPICAINANNRQEYFFESLKECEANSINTFGSRIAAETIRKYCENGREYKGFFFKCANSTIQN